jgi:hypothetical protein
MIRNILGALLALIGAAAAVFSTFRAWYEGRLGRDYKLEELFTSDSFTSGEPSLFLGLFLPMAFAALITVIAVALRLRWLVVIAGLIVLATVVLWAVRQEQTTGLYISGGNGVGNGAAFAVGGGLLLLLAAVVMRGRGPRRVGRHSGGYIPPETGRDDEDAPPTQPTVARAPLPGDAPQERLWYGTPGASPARGAEGREPAQQQPPAQGEEGRTRSMPQVGGEPWPPDPRDRGGAGQTGQGEQAEQPGQSDQTQNLRRGATRDGDRHGNPGGRDAA